MHFFIGIAFGLEVQQLHARSLIERKENFIFVVIDSIVLCVSQNA